MVREGKRAQNTVGEWQKKRKRKVKKKQERKGISVLEEELAVGNTRQFSIFGHDAVKAELKFTQSGSTATTTRGIRCCKPASDARQCARRNKARA